LDEQFVGSSFASLLPAPSFSSVTSLPSSSAISATSTPSLLSSSSTPSSLAQSSLLSSIDDRPLAHIQRMRFVNNVSSSSPTTSMINGVDASVARQLLHQSPIETIRQSIAHLETQIASSIAIGSPDEWRTWLTTYIRCNFFALILLTDF
jgi:hypothetical protein